MGNKIFLWHQNSKTITHNMQMHSSNVQYSAPSPQQTARVRCALCTECDWIDWKNLSAVSSLVYRFCWFFTSTTATTKATHCHQRNVIINALLQRLAVHDRFAHEFVWAKCYIVIYKATLQWLHIHSKHTLLILRARIASKCE